jgi:hypothetical protein
MKREKEGYDISERADNYLNNPETRAKEPNTMSNSPEIVPPEPHSTGADFRKAWSHMPRWLQITFRLSYTSTGSFAILTLPLL